MSDAGLEQELEIEEDIAELEDKAIQFSKEALLELIQAKNTHYLSRLFLFHEKTYSSVLEFIQGKVRLMSFAFISQEYPDNIGFDFRYDAASLFHKLTDLAREKGFRENIESYDEHRAIASTVPDRYSQFPNFPLGVANYLFDVGIPHGEILSITEARIARELAGKTTLNKDGTISEQHAEQSNVPRDIYRFLSPERREEVIKTEQMILKSLTQLFEIAYSQKNKKLQELEKTISEYMDGKHDIQYVRKVAQEIEKDTGHMSLGIFDPVGIMGFDAIETARELSYKSGNRDFYLTPQEITIMGREVDPKYLENLWTPLGIQDGTLSVKDARDIRRKEKEIRWLTDAVSGYKQYININFEQLDNEGATIAGPFKNFGSESIEIFKDRARIPFSREGDWYHNPA